MRRILAPAFMRLWFVAVPSATLLACGGVDPGGGGGGGVFDFLDDTSGEGEGEGEAAAEVEAEPDTIELHTGGEELVFPNATGGYRAENDRTVIGGGRTTDSGTETVALATSGQSSGSITCDVSNVISWNAWDGDNPVAYSSRREGGSCSLELLEYGDVGERIRGTFDAVLVDADGNVAETSGSFDVPRIEDQ